FYCIFEMRSMGANHPCRIGRRLDEFRRHWVAGRPQLHRLVIDSIDDAQNFRAGVARVSMSANLLQDRSAARFEVPMQDARRSSRRSTGSEMLRCDLQHGSAARSDARNLTPRRQTTPASELTEGIRAAAAGRHCALKEVVLIMVL